MQTDKHTTGQLILQHRKSLALTQQECANRLGVVHSRWADLEADRKSPTVRMLSRVAKVLGCTVADLVK